MSNKQYLPYPTPEPTAVALGAYLLRRVSQKGVLDLDAERKSPNDPRYGLATRLPSKG